MYRLDATEYVAFVVDDSGNGRELNADRYAVIRTGQLQRLAEDTDDTEHTFDYPSVLVGWQCGFEPLFVAVHSYLDVEIGDDEAMDLARDYLAERGWFAGEPTEPDYIIR